MNDYISRKAAVNAFFPVDPENDGSDGTTPIYLERAYSNNEIESILWEIPTADVVAVVRCRDCKLANKDELMNKFWCNRFLGCIEVREDDFCSYGVRKEDNP